MRLVNSIGNITSHNRRHTLVDGPELWCVRVCVFMRHWQVSNERCSWVIKLNTVFLALFLSFKHTNTQQTNIFFPLSIMCDVFFFAQLWIISMYHFVVVAVLCWIKWQKHLAADKNLTCIGIHATIETIIHFTYRLIFNLFSSLFVFVFAIAFIV